MHGVFIVTVVFTGIVLALAIVGGTILMAIKIIKGGGSYCLTERKRKIHHETI